MRIIQIRSSRGNYVPNQIIVNDVNIRFAGVHYVGSLFISYGMPIAFKGYEEEGDKRLVLLNEDDWDYSGTTGKYRNAFLGEYVGETRAKLKSGEYCKGEFDLDADFSVGGRVEETIFD